MNSNNMAALFVAVALCSVPGRAQTAAELMQKAIYTQETAGDLDGAISIYRQIVSSGSSPRDVAAQAQYRLAQSLLQKGDLATGAQEFDKLARNYADYSKLVSSLAAQAAVRITAAPVADQANADRLKLIESQLRAAKGQQRALAAETAGGGNERAKAETAKLLEVLQSQIRMVEASAAMAFDGGRSVTVKGIMISSSMLNPAGSITVDPKDGSGKLYTFLTAAPAELIRQGWTKGSLQLGAEVTVTGNLARGEQTLPDGALAGRAASVTRGDGRKLFDRSAIQ